MASKSFKWSLVLKTNKENYGQLLGFIGFIYKYGLSELLNSISIIHSDLDFDSVHYLERFQLIRVVKYEFGHNICDSYASLEAFGEGLSLVAHHLKRKSFPLMVMSPPYFFIHPVNLIQADFDGIFIVESKNGIKSDLLTEKSYSLRFLTLIFFESSATKLLSVCNASESLLREDTLNHIDWKHVSLSSLFKDPKLKVALFSASELSVQLARINENTSLPNIQNNSKFDVSSTGAISFNALDEEFNVGQYLDHLEYQRHRIKSLYNLPTPAHRDPISISQSKAKHLNLPFRLDRFVMCDGGMANRIYSLLYPLCGGRLDVVLPLVYWPSTQVCAARFDSLFDSKLMVIESMLLSGGMDETKVPKCDLTFITHQSVPSIPATVQFDSNELSESLYNSLWCDSGGICVYNNNVLPPWFNIGSRLNEIADALMMFRPKRELIESATTFFDSIPDNNDVIGLHIRGTDFNPDISYIEKLVLVVKANPKSNFFICSDDKEIKARFNDFKNTFSRDLPSFVNYDRTTGGIFRSSDSVREGLIDLLVLSRCNIMSTSNSSYLQLAKILRAIRKLNFDFGW